MRKVLFVLAVISVLFAAVPSSAKTRPLPLSEDFIQAINKSGGETPPDYRTEGYRAQIHRRWGRDSSVSGEYVTVCEGHTLTTHWVLDGKNHDLSEKDPDPAKEAETYERTVGDHLLSFSDVVAMGVINGEEVYRIWASESIKFAYEPCQTGSKPRHKHILLSVWYYNHGVWDVKVSQITEKRFKKLAR